MPQLSPGQIAGVVKEAGWPTAEIPLAVAIVLGESGGKSDELGDVNLQTSYWGPSVGLFQIRSVNSERGKGTVRDQNANMDPLTNARHALHIRQTQGLTAWSVFNTKAYVQYMGKALLAAANPLSVTGLLPDLPNPLAGTTDALSTFRNTLKALADGTIAMRALMIIGGFYMMYLSVLMMFFGSSAGQTTVVVGKAAVKTIVGSKVIK